MNISQQSILDVVRENQEDISALLLCLHDNPEMGIAKDVLDQMHKHDRDAILQPGGILNDAQIELLK